MAEAAGQSAAQRAANARFYEKARADDLDPTGKFGGYPDWARSALSAKGRR